MLKNGFVREHFLPRLWRSDGNCLVANRVLKCHAVGMKGDAAIWVGTGGSVFQIAFYRASHVGKLASNLVMPSGVEYDFKQVVSTC